MPFYFCLYFPFCSCSTFNFFLPLILSFFLSFFFFFDATNIAQNRAKFIENITQMCKEAEQESVDSMSSALPLFFLSSPSPLLPTSSHSSSADLLLLLAHSLYLTICCSRRSRFHTNNDKREGRQWQTIIL